MRRALGLRFLGRGVVTMRACWRAMAIGSPRSIFPTRRWPRRGGWRRRDGVDVAVEQRDVFTLGRDYAGAFDGVWEYTCFCAIDPGRREEYMRVLHAILRPGGLLLACFYPLREGGDGPPFPVSRGDIDRALAGRFTVERAGPPGRSADRRRDLEWLVAARRS